MCKPGLRFSTARESGAADVLLTGTGAEPQPRAHAEILGGELWHYKI